MCHFQTYSSWQIQSTQGTHERRMLGHGSAIRQAVPAFHKPRTKQEHFCSVPALESVASLSVMEVTMTDQTQTVSNTGETDAHVMAVIEACGGDPKLAIRALLVEQEILEQRIGRLASALSFGYVRCRTGVGPGQSG
jgi:hypothetical protein